MPVRLGAPQAGAGAFGDRITAGSELGEEDLVTKTRLKVLASGS